MHGEMKSMVGIGVYTVAEAARLTATATATVRRWMLGYRYRRRGEARARPPLWQPDIEPFDGRVTLSFLDLMEVRFIRAFRQHGVSWPAIRRAAEIACDLFQDAHPFTRRRFRTDGARIFQQIEDGGRVRLFDLNRQSWVFNEIVAPSLYAGIEFSGEHMTRWFPIEGSSAIVIDPAIAFGRPTIAEQGVPTDTIAAAVRAHDGDYAEVARWYDLPVRAVKAAVKFEQRLAA